MSVVVIEWSNLTNGWHAGNVYGSNLIYLFMFVCFKYGFEKCHKSLYVSQNEYSRKYVSSQMKLKSTSWNILECVSRNGLFRNRSLGIRNSLLMRETCRLLSCLIHLYVIWVPLQTFTPILGHVTLFLSKI